MPIVAEKDLKPTLIVEPDMRFATAFLDTKYRDYAVPGEALMDKTSGELFMKRKADGKVVSFFQNKKMTHDVVLELRVLLVNNPSFRYPNSDEESFFVSTNYDVIAMNNEHRIDLKESSIESSFTQESINGLKFRLAGRSTGFFMRFASRDVDKPVIEYLTNQYNQICEWYDTSGGDTNLIIEKNKFTSISKWKDSNIIVSYDLDVYRNNVKTTFPDLVDYVRFNESMAVQYPEQIKNRFPDGIDYCEVRIKKLDFYKLHFMIHYMDQFDASVKAGYEKLVFKDNRIEPAELNVMHFVNNVDHILLLGNETIITFMDIPYINRYMGKLANLMGPAEFIIAVDRPYDNIWSANGVWAERIRDLAENGKVIYNKPVTDLKDLERYFAPGTGTAIGGRIVTDKNLKDDFLLTEVTDASEHEVVGEISDDPYDIEAFYIAPGPGL